MKEINPKYGNFTPIYQYVIDYDKPKISLIDIVKMFKDDKVNRPFFYSSRYSGELCFSAMIQNQSITHYNRLYYFAKKAIVAYELTLGYIYANSIEYADYFNCPHCKETVINERKTITSCPNCGIAFVYKRHSYHLRTKKQKEEPKTTLYLPEYDCVTDVDFEEN